MMMIASNPDYLELSRIDKGKTIVNSEKYPKKSCHINPECDLRAKYAYDSHIDVPNKVKYHD
jgi:hypothetical protein